ncbi:hypothetical protein CGRA01v4_11312 [Colletotrichum graminicola]|nr:hypothetical protein CGRA01v4_11312 [Colletotrichum graminicola]
MAWHILSQPGLPFVPRLPRNQLASNS